MQFYTHDRVIVKEGVLDSDNGKSLSGYTGRINKILSREDNFPIQVDIYNEDTGFFEEYFFKPEELILDAH